MQLETQGILEIANSIGTTYDQSMKNIISCPQIMAVFLPTFIPELKQFSQSDLVEILQHVKIELSKIPTDPGKTNFHELLMKMPMDRIDEKLGEGFIVYDVLFRLISTVLNLRTIVNIELMKNLPTDYAMIDRSLFYNARNISSQKDREFFHMDYSNIWSVNGIWICFNCPENKIIRSETTQSLFLGAGKIDSPSFTNQTFMVHVTKDIPEQSEENYLFRFFAILGSEKLSSSDRILLLEREYIKDLKPETKKEIQFMSNLGIETFKNGVAEGKIEGIIEGEKRGITKGRMEGRYENKIEVIRKMLSRKCSKTFISEMVDLPISEVEQIINHIKADGNITPIHQS